jgi:F0F1-type ATP synthase assembly protein I
MSQRLPDPKEVGRLFAIGQVGMEMTAPIGIGLALDYWWHSLPWATVAGAVLGFVFGIFHLVRILNKEERNDRSKPPTGSP